jgi:hypothetical protein
VGKAGKTPSGWLLRRYKLSILIDVYVNVNQALHYQPKDAA